MSVWKFLFGLVLLGYLGIGYGNGQEEGVKKTETEEGCCCCCPGFCEFLKWFCCECGDEPVSLNTDRQEMLLSEYGSLQNKDQGATGAKIREERCSLEGRIGERSLDVEFLETKGDRPAERDPSVVKAESADRPAERDPSVVKAEFDRGAKEWQRQLSQLTEKCRRDRHKNASQE